MSVLPVSQFWLRRKNPFSQKTPKLAGSVIVDPLRHGTFRKKGQLFSRRFGRAPLSSPARLRHTTAHLPVAFFRRIFIICFFFWGGGVPVSQGSPISGGGLLSHVRRRARRRSQESQRSVGARTRKQKCLFWTWLLLLRFVVNSCLKSVPFPAFLAPNCISKCFC